jgi:hypothetical protein
MIRLLKSLDTTVPPSDIRDNWNSLELSTPSSRRIRLLKNLDTTVPPSDIRDNWNSLELSTPSCRMIRLLKNLDSTFLSHHIGTIGILWNFLHPPVV